MNFNSIKLKNATKSQNSQIGKRYHLVLDILLLSMCDLSWIYSLIFKNDKKILIEFNSHTR